MILHDDGGAAPALGGMAEAEREERHFSHVEAKADESIRLATSPLLMLKLRYSVAVCALAV